MFGISDEQYEQLFDAFLKDHPECAEHGRWMPIDGKNQFMIRVEAIEPFARWAAAKGLCDPQRAQRFIAEVVPQLTSFGRDN